MAAQVQRAAPLHAVVASGDIAAPDAATSAEAIRVPGSSVSLSLPVGLAVDPPEVVDQGMIVYPGRRRTDPSVAVAEDTSPNTTPALAIHTVIPGPGSPHRYSYHVLGARPVLSEDGSVDLLADTDGMGVAKQRLGSIAVPWARDAVGAEVPTRFEVHGNTVEQIVEFDRSTTFPVVADPSVKMCDWYTAYCVKFSRSETKAVNDAMFVSVGAGVNTLCGFIPLKSWGIAIRAVCSALVAGVFYSMRSTFNSAKKAGKCVEVKWGILGPVGIRGWKVVSC